MYLSEKFSIAEVSFQIISKDRSITEYFSNAYIDFLLPKSEGGIRYVSGKKQRLELLNDKQTVLVVVSHDKRRKKIAWYYNLLQKKVLVKLPSKTEASRLEKNIDFAELEYVIKIALTLYLYQKNSLLLHGSAFVKNGEAHVFCAPSGTGKSTVCNFAKQAGYTVIADDSILVTVQDTHKNDYSDSKKQLIAHTTPFLETHKAKSFNAQYPVAGIYFLHQSNHTELQLQNKSKSIQDMLTNSYLYQMDVPRENIPGYFDLACNIISVTLCYDLFFTKSNEFLSIV